MLWLLQSTRVCACVGIERLELVGYVELQASEFRCLESNRSKTLLRSLLFALQLLLELQSLELPHRIGHTFWLFLWEQMPIASGNNEGVCPLIGVELHLLAMGCLPQCSARCRWAFHAFALWRTLYKRRHCCATFLDESCLGPSRHSGMFLLERFSCRRLKSDLMLLYHSAHKFRACRINAGQSRWFLHRISISSASKLQSAIVDLSDPTMCRAALNNLSKPQLDRHQLAKRRMQARKFWGCRPLCHM